MAKQKKNMNKAEDKMSKKKHAEPDINQSSATDQNPELNNEETKEIKDEVIDPVALLQSELDAINDKYLRLNAEFQNYRKRVEKEKSDIFKFGNEKFMTELLPIMDNFERALAASEQENSESKVFDGVKMIKKSLDDFFEKNELKKIEALGKPFDPIKHHAVMTVESEDESKDHVVEVFQEGYMLADKVIRPSMVKVSH